MSQEANKHMCHLLIQYAFCNVLLCTSEAALHSNETAGYGRMGTRQWHPYYMKAQAKMERAITVAAKIFTLNSLYPTNYTEPRGFKEAKYGYLIHI